MSNTEREYEHDQMDSERLLQAAEAAMRAADEIAEYTGGPRPYPADLMGSELQPDYLAEFTKWEIEQACEFLVRMGMLDAPPQEHRA